MGESAASGSPTAGWDSPWPSSPKWPSSPGGWSQLAASSARNSPSSSPEISPRTPSSISQSPRPLSIKRQERGEGPCVFVINCHGVTFPDSTTGEPAEMEVKVDTFTTAKFGHPVAKYLIDTKTFSFFDQPYNYFIPEILKSIRASSSPPNKDVLRDIITRSLCHTRANVGVFVPGTCKFKCHKVGDPISKTMADMFIMCPGSSMVEAVFSVDLTTGTKEDVYDKFGFELVTNPLVTRPTHDKIEGLERVAFDRESGELKLIRRTQPEEYRRRYALLAQAKRVLKGEVKSANYRYNDDYKHKYVTFTFPNGDTYDMIKLSDVIQIAIDNGTIHPETDFVIVQACRTFDGQLPPGYGDKSPGRKKGDLSDGGSKKRKTGTRTRPRTKNRNNRNRNNRNKNNTKKRKRKTKTIRRT